MFDPLEASIGTMLPQCALAPHCGVRCDLAAADTPCAPMVDVNDEGGFVALAGEGMLTSFEPLVLRMQSPGAGICIWHLCHHR